MWVASGVATIQPGNQARMLCKFTLSTSLFHAMSQSSVSNQLHGVTGTGVPDAYRKAVAPPSTFLEPLMPFAVALCMRLNLDHRICWLSAVIWLHIKQTTEYTAFWPQCLLNTPRYHPRDGK